MAGILLAVGDQKFRKALDIKFVLGNHAAVRGSGHRGEHGSETGITAEDFQDQEAFVGAGTGAQAVGHGNGARHAGAKTDAIVGAGNIIVHGFGNGDHLHTFLVKTDAVAKRVIATDRDEVVDAEPIQVFQNFRGQVVLLGVVGGLQMNRNAGLLYLAGIGAGAMQEGAAGAAGAVDQILRQHLEVFAIVVVFFADNVDQSRPAAADANHFAALAQRADGYRADGRVQAGHIASTGQDSDHTFLRLHCCSLSIRKVAFALASNPLPQSVGLNSCHTRE